MHKKAFNILGYFFNWFVDDRDIDDSGYATKKVMEDSLKCTMRSMHKDITIWQQWMIFFVGNVQD